MNKLKRYYPFFLTTFLVFIASQIAHYVFYGKFFFYLINSLILSLYIAWWPFSKITSAHNRSFGRYRIAIGIVMLFWFLCKCAKDRFLMENDDLKRICWYAFYVAMILLPLLCYEFSLQFDRPSSAKLRRRVMILRITAAVLITSILTNDLHQMAFSFPDGIAEWSGSRSFGPMYFAATAFGLAMFIIALVRIFRQCTLPKSKRYIWLPILPLGVGGVYLILYSFNLDLHINGIRFFALTDTFCYLIMIFIDACEVVYQIATEIPDEESLLLHRIWGEIGTRMDRAEQSIGDDASAGESDFKENLFRAGFLQTYSKRVSNLILLGEQNGSLDFAELSLSLAESVEFLKLNGVEAMLAAEGQKRCTLYEMLAVYREFEERLEPMLPKLGAVLVVVTADRRNIRLRISAEDKGGNAL